MWPQWHIFWFRRQPKCGGRFAWLSKLPGLATCKGATVEVVKARCHNSSCNLCLSFGPFETRSLQQRRLCQNHNVGTGHQLEGSEMVLSRDRVVKKRWSCEVVGSHHCWFDISWPIAYLPISTSSKYAWLASHPNLAVLQEWQRWDCY